MFLSANPGRPPPTHGVAARPGENRNNLGLCPSPKSRWGWRSRARLRDTQGHLPCRGTTREGLRLARRGLGGARVGFWSAGCGERSPARWGPAASPPPLKSRIALAPRPARGPAPQAQGRPSLPQGPGPYRPGVIPGQPRRAYSPCSPEESPILRNPTLAPTATAPHNLMQQRPGSPAPRSASLPGHVRSLGNSRGLRRHLPRGMLGVVVPTWWPTAALEPPQSHVPRWPGSRGLRRQPARGSGRRSQSRRGETDKKHDSSHAWLFTLALHRLVQGQATAGGSERASGGRCVLVWTEE